MKLHFLPQNLPKMSINENFGTATKLYYEPKKQDTTLLSVTSPYFKILALVDLLVNLQ